MTETAKVRIDCEDDTDALDDLAIDGSAIRMLRLERLSDCTFWGAIHMNDGTIQRMTIGADGGKLSFRIEQE